MDDSGVASALSAGFAVATDMDAVKGRHSVLAVMASVFGLITFGLVYLLLMVHGVVSTGVEQLSLIRDELVTITELLTPAAAEGGTER